MIGSFNDNFQLRLIASNRIKMCSRKLWTGAVVKEIGRGLFLRYHQAFFWLVSWTNNVAYLLKARTVKPGKTRCYTTTGKQAMTPLSKESLLRQPVNFFNRFPNLSASCGNTFSKWCNGMRGRVDECSVAPLCNKRMETLCGCREEGVQTKDYYKLKLITKAYDRPTVSWPVCLGVGYPSRAHD
jgi:hypothetical protein